MTRRKKIPDPVLMLITILLVSGFQLYWLRNSYDRERRSLQLKSSAAFQETVRRIQTAKLRLKDPGDQDSTFHNDIRISVVANAHDTGDPHSTMPRREIITMVNAMRDRIRDSLANEPPNSLTYYSTKKHIDVPGSNRSIETSEEQIKGKGAALRFLYEVDSLQDSLKVSEIAEAYGARLKQDQLAVPFRILRFAKVGNDDEDFSAVTVGFVNPVTYRLELGNTFPYLIKQLTIPILFSVFLIGLTIVSFVLLYRNLLNQRRLAELKNEFIGNITHELKTPIATVSVAIEALKNFNAMQNPQRTAEYLDISANELQRLGLLVDKVLKLSMFEKKEIELKYEPFDLQGVVDEVVTSMRLQIEKHNATLTMHHEGDTIVNADRLHLLSVVFNLVDNAIKYSKDQPRIEIRVDGNDTHVELSVRDEGIGIGAEYKNKIFEKFFRVPTGNMHNAKGYGLGLSYVAHVVKQHRGSIAVDSEIDRGTTITISLPKQPA